MQRHLADDVKRATLDYIQQLEASIKAGHGEPVGAKFYDTIPRGPLSKEETVAHALWFLDRAREKVQSGTLDGVERCGASAAALVLPFGILAGFYLPGFGTIYPALHA